MIASTLAVRRAVAPIIVLCAARLCAADSLDGVQKLAGDWVRTRAETVRLETELTTDRVLLESIVNGLKERAATLEEKRDNVKAGTAKDRDELETMRAKNKVAADDLRAAEQRLKELCAQLLELRPQLPPRLSEALELPYRSLDTPNLATGERMQMTTTILNRCAQFNRTLTCGEDVLTIEGEGGAKSLEVIYVGLSYGYALDRRAAKAWRGSPGPQGWAWEARHEAAAAVGELIAIFNDKEDPHLVSVPARINHLVAATAGTKP